MSITPIILSDQSKDDEISQILATAHAQAMAHIRSLRSTTDAIIDRADDQATDAQRRLTGVIAEKEDLLGRIRELEVANGKLTGQLNSDAAHQTIALLQSQLDRLRPIADESERLNALLDSALAENQRLTDAMRQLRLTLRGR